MTVDDEWRRLLAALASGQTISPASLRAVLRDVFSGTAGAYRTGALLALLGIDRVSPEQLAIICETAFEFSLPLDIDESFRRTLVDTCGTGGTPQRREAALNISTVAGLVLAAAGVPVCKHGNRRVTSTSGSFDLLEALGVRVDLKPSGVARCIREAGFGACLATTFHPAFKHLAPARLELGITTVFNILGPLTNPARASAQLIGAALPRVAELIAGALRPRGMDRALVVASRDGSDEVSLDAPTDVVEVQGAHVRRWTLEAGKFFLPSDRAPVSGGSAAHNAQLTLDLLNGRRSDFRCLVVANAAMALQAAGRCDDFEQGVSVASEAIDSGRGGQVLMQLRETSNASEIAL